MNAMVYIALYGWIPAVMGLFMILPPRRAVVAAFMIAWLFLPMASFKIHYLPDYSKMTATCLGVLIAAAVWDTQRLATFRPHWADLPVVVFCLAPFGSSISNGLGAYDGISTAFQQSVLWGLPYFIGRIYFSDIDGLRELAVGIVLGGIVYLPLCWLEMRLSPQLHRWVYGYHQHSFVQTIRFGGYRPTVFMQHGLMVAMWMTMTALTGLWLWMSRSVRSVLGMPLGPMVALMLGTAVLCRSAYAILLVMLATTALFAARFLRTRLAVIALLLIPPTFITLRASMIFDGWSMVEWSTEMFGADRARSIQTRVENDNLLSQRALEQPLFGWGGWGRARVRDETGRSTTVTDSLWVITLGNNGLVGLVSLQAMLLLPMVLVMWDYHVRLWSSPRVAPAVVLALILVLYMMDHLMNGMVNPVYMLSAGALGSAHVWAEAQRRLASRVQVVTARPVPPEQAGAAWT
jgi:hypothetical protein